MEKRLTDCVKMEQKKCNELEKNKYITQKKVTSRVPAS